MRLLVPTRICLALRWATTPAASKVVTPTPKLSKLEKEKLRETTRQREALAYLDAGKNEEFRVQWKGKVLGGVLSDNEALCDALLRRANSGTPDRAMLRWYADSLVNEARTPFPAKTHFESIMVPVVRALGGRIENWEEDDVRKEKLRKWRDDYTDEALEKLMVSMLEYITKLTEKKKFPDGNMVILERALERVKRQERTVAVDWSDIVHFGVTKSLNVDNLLPHHSLVKVGLEATSNLFQFCDFNDRLLEESSEVKGAMNMDGFCTLMLAVASRGHWLSNKPVKNVTDIFRGYNLKKNKGDSSQANLLNNFANDSVLRFTNSGVVQPAVDHSRAPQFIDSEKKELAFTVARDIGEPLPKHPCKSIEYYSILLD